MLPSSYSLTAPLVVALVGSEARLPLGSATYPVSNARTRRVVQRSRSETERGKRVIGERSPLCVVLRDLGYPRWDE